jgi:hypothetical protein
MAPGWFSRRMGLAAVISTAEGRNDEFALVTAVGGGGLNGNFAGGLFAQSQCDKAEIFPKWGAIL